MAQIPDRLPAFVQETEDNWNVWYGWQGKDNPPTARVKVMGAVPELVAFSKSLHLEAQRMEQERDYWKGAAGRYFTQLLRRQKGVISLPIPFTKFRIILTREEDLTPPVLPQEGGDGGT
jgi:hypothetical protein